MKCSAISGSDSISSIIESTTEEEVALSFVIETMKAGIESMIDKETEEDDSTMEEQEQETGEDDEAPEGGLLVTATNDETHRTLAT